MPAPNHSFSAPYISSAEPRGRIVGVLHAHLPFVRHSEYPHFYEEDWLFEAIEGCYLPILSVFDGWIRDRIKARLVVSLSPTLLAMLRDPLLQDRFRRYLERRVALWTQEAERYSAGPARWRIHAERELQRVFNLQSAYEHYQGDLVSAFVRAEEGGVVELITTAGTHPLLPLFEHHPEFVRAQVRAGVLAFTEAIGRQPLGMWLPECGWFSTASQVLEEAGIRYTFVESTGLLYGSPAPQCGWRRPVVTSDGVLVFGRDPKAARLVWSRDLGYPGDGRYLDFHADQTYKRSDDELKDYVLDDGTRVPLRLRYHRVTDRNLPTEAKDIYDLEASKKAVDEHAEHFVATQVEALQQATEVIGWPAYTVALFDAELFGHWWREGPMFLDAVVRKGVDKLEFQTGVDVLNSGEPFQSMTPALSTWGEHGDVSVWLNPKTAWMWPRLLDAVLVLSRASKNHGHKADPLISKILAQMARELFLAVASDWPFLVHLGTAPEYSVSRVKEHLKRVKNLQDMLEADEVDIRLVEEYESHTPIFSWMDYPKLSDIYSD